MWIVFLGCFERAALHEKVYLSVCSRWYWWNWAALSTAFRVLKLAHAFWRAVHTVRRTLFMSSEAVCEWARLHIWRVSWVFGPPPFWVSRHKNVPSWSEKGLNGCSLYSHGHAWVPLCCCCSALLFTAAASSFCKGQMLLLLLLLLLLEQTLSVVGEDRSGVKGCFQSLSLCETRTCTTGSAAATPEPKFLLELFAMWIKVLAGSSCRAAPRGGLLLIRFIFKSLHLVCPVAVGSVPSVSADRGQASSSLITDFIVYRQTNI